MKPAISVEALLKRLCETPDEIEFSETIVAIESAYDYTPTAFRNDDVHNEAGQNAGSCKLLEFANLQGLSEAETLARFGRYYRDDVLKNPEGTDHQNIRNFMSSGWLGVFFEGSALQTRGGGSRFRSRTTLDGIMGFGARVGRGRIVYERRRARLSFGLEAR